MIPDLGPHALPVLGSYAATLALLGLLVALSMRRATRIRARLRELEDKTREPHV